MGLKFVRRSCDIVMCTTLNWYYEVCGYVFYGISACHDFAFVMHKLRQRYAVMLCNNSIF